MSEVSYSPETDYYELFGVPPTVGPEELAKAHKRLAKSCHPDLHPDKAWATERFKEINRAYAILKDPVAKGEYDRLRWAEIGPDRVGTGRPMPAGEYKKPKKGTGTVDPQRHKDDRRMSYFIMGIEVVVLTFFMVLVVYRALTKHKY